MTKRKLMKMRKEALKTKEIIQFNKESFTRGEERLLKYIKYTLELTQHLIDQSLIKEK